MKSSAQSVSSRRVKRDRQNAAERTNISILRYVLDHPDAVRRNIAADLTLSFPNVCRLVSRFEKAGILESSDFKQTGRRGPLSRTLSLRPGIGCTVGVDLESTHIRGLILDFANDVVGTLRRPVPSSASPDEIVSMVADAAASLVSSATEQKLPVHAVGIALPGPMIDPTKGRVRTELQSGLFEVEFAPEVEKATGVPVFPVANELCFAHGHHRMYHSRATDTEMVILNRFGLSTAIIRNTSVYNGHLGLLPYGTNAHFQDICAGVSLIQLARSRGDSRLLQELLSSPTDPIVSEWLADAIPAFALVIYAGIVMETPSRVIIEGIFNRMPPEIRNEIKSVVVRELDRVDINPPPITFFEGDDLMGARGAAFLARDNLADEVISQQIVSNNAATP